MNIPKDLMAASTVPLVLALLSREDGYGYELVRRVWELSNGHVQWRESTIYSVLHRLKRRGWVETRLSRNPRGPDRIYYHLTAKGTAALNDQLEPWVLLFLTLKKINPKTLKIQ